jgi:hypothetical protein
METEKMRKEREFVEKELSVLLQMTFSLEAELEELVGVD